MKVNCDRCLMLSINGVACHETGCRNANARWVDGVWIAQRECFECGSMIDRDSHCCCDCPNCESNREESDESLACPECERPNQFGELCEACRQES
jgi:hypothetical protein